MPEQTNSKWSPIRWPKRFELALSYGVYADWLRLDGQFDKAASAERALEEETERILAVLLKQQRQGGQTRVNTR
jgi:hypothetical protein